MPSTSTNEEYAEVHFIHSFSFGNIKATVLEYRQRYTELWRRQRFLKRDCFEDLISGFRREVAEIFALLGYHAANSGNFLHLFTWNYRLEGPGIESRWGDIFRTYPDRLRGPSSLLYNGYRVFPGGKSGRGVMLTAHPLLVPRLRKSWAIPPLTLWVLLGLLRGSPLPLLTWKSSA
jgi:hypothetical protein